MKSFTQFLLERGPAPVKIKFVCAETSKEISKESILDFSLNSNYTSQLFTMMKNDKFNDYVVFLMKREDNSTVTVLTDSAFRFENYDGGIIVNNNDDRDIYDCRTINNDKNVDGIILIKKKDYMNWK